MDFNWLNLFLILLLAWVLGLIVSRLGYPSVLGELAAGIIFGPPVMGVVHGDTGTAILGRIGVMMMLLFIGTQINPNDLVRAARVSLLPAVGGFLVPFALGYLATTQLFGGNFSAGLVVGTVMGTTSLATMSRVNVDLNLLRTHVGQMMTTIALFSVIIMLVTFSVVMGVALAGNIQLGAVALILGKSLLFLVIMVGAGVYGFPLLGKLQARLDVPDRTDDLTFALALTALGALLAETLGLSYILGAFLVGLFLRPDMFEQDIFGGILQAIRNVALGFLAPVFYVGAGFSVSFGVFVSNPTVVIAVVLLALLGKFLGVFLFYWVEGRGWREAMVIGSGMNARGGVDIIAAGVALQAGIISKDVFTALICSIFLGTLSVPLALKLGTDWLRRRGELIGVDDEPAPKLAPSAPQTTS